MGIIDVIKGKVEEVADSVEDMVESHPAQVQAVEAAVDSIVTAAPPADVSSEPSTYNCPACLGTGLKNESNRCATCRGSGKIN